MALLTPSFLVIVYIYFNAEFIFQFIKYEMLKEFAMFQCLQPVTVGSKIVCAVYAMWLLLITESVMFSRGHYNSNNSKSINIYKHLKHSARIPSSTTTTEVCELRSFLVLLF
jgi:hypothetical protein